MCDIDSFRGKDMITTEIHVPITLNEHFAVMSCLLVRSIACNAQLPGAWKVVFTCSLDSDLALDSPLLGWAEDHPVEFRWVEESLWEHYDYCGTGLQRHLYPFAADVLLFMDADIVVVGSLNELVRQAADADAVLAWPAWQPPTDIDWTEVFQRLEMELPAATITYSGYGIAFMSPKDAPPYFNYGFVAIPRSLALAIGPLLQDGIDHVWSIYRNWFTSQIALCIAIVRARCSYRALDLRYNCSNGDYDVPEIRGPQADMFWQDSLAKLADLRVLHYCVPTPEFTKSVDMSTWVRFEDFCGRELKGEGSLRLQKAVRPLRDGAGATSGVERR